MNSDSMKCAAHATVSIVYAVAAGYALYLGVEMPKEFYKNEIFRVGRDYFWYLLCTWLGMIHHFYFGIYSAIDIIERVPPTKSLVKLVNNLHSLGSFILFSVVFPFAVMVSILFWTIFLWDREKVYPNVVDEYLPFWLNHFMHTYPLPLAIFYMATTNQKLPSKTNTFLGLLVFMAVYLIFLIKHRLMTGQWLYFVFNSSTPTQTVLLMAFSLLGPFVFHFVGYKLQIVLNDATNSYLKKDTKVQ
ncbi:androgen-dependent TFPI-regulating protein-like [Cimex lectularius]|uniref:Androgen-dependent TFPI-regulating protein n=1 Tax=Cimex lectularius TaxID=79782 RepID=A0A8I6TGH8_CIMLE|nr:androgen-dependent TFPI-regulating protein-like [Cimex lectularius]